MLTVDDARNLILDRIAPVDVESVDVVDAAGRVVGQDEKAARAIPAFDNSAMDGVGVRAADVASASVEAPVALRVAGASLAGSGAEALAELAAGECVRIMTGAPIPPGVDAVVMRESTDEARASAGTIAVREAAAPGQHIRRRGEDIAQGALVAKAGDVVTPGRMNAILAAGLARIVVHRRPVVAVLASGDELKEIGRPLGETDVPNSNAHAVAALLRAAGCEVRMLGIAADTLDDHVTRMRQALDADALVTIGGVSMGTHDFVRPALEKLGGTLEMWKVAMRPGKPIAFGRVARETRVSLPILGLPGNPVSALVASELFLRPAVEKLRGARALVRPLLRVTLASIEGGAAFTKKRGLEHWARAFVRVVDGALAADVIDKQGSHHIAAFARANALVRFGPDVERAAPGDVVDAMLLESPATLRQR